MIESPTLLERIASGDRSAVALCIDRYGGLVWSLTRRFVTIEADAEEMVQEIFMELWAKASRYDSGRGDESTFVSMLARRRLIDKVRQLKRAPQTQSFDTIDHAMSSDGAAAMEAGSETQRVHRAMTELKPEQRQVIHLSTWLGMSHADIAAQTGMPLGSVKTQLRRGLQRIRDVLGESRLADGGAR